MNIDGKQIENIDEQRKNISNPLFILLKAGILTALTYFMVKVSLLWWDLHYILLTEKRVLILKYIWLTPLDLNTSFVSSTIITNVIVVISGLFMGGILYRACNVWNKVFRSRNVKGIVNGANGVHNSICWIVSYFSVHLINVLLPLESLSFLSSYPGSLFMQIYLKIIFVFLTIYTIKFMYLDFLTIIIKKYLWEDYKYVN